MDTVAQCGYDIRYGRARIDINTDRMDARDDEIYDTLIHEMTHLTIAPIVELIDSQIDNLKSDGRDAEARMLKERIVMAEESLVCDVAHAGVIELSLRRKVKFGHVEFIDVLKTDEPAA